MSLSVEPESATLEALPPLIQIFEDHEAGISLASHRAGGSLLFSVDRYVLLVQSFTIEAANQGPVRDALLSFAEEEALARGCWGIEFDREVVPITDIQNPSEYFKNRGYAQTVSGKWEKRIDQSPRTSQPVAA